MSWTPIRLEFFRRMYEYMKANQAEFTKPEMEPIYPRDWGIISRIAALWAAKNAPKDLE